MKTIKTAVLVALCSVGTSFALNELVSIDSLAIMQKSKEGQEVMKTLQADVAKFQNEIQVVQKKLADEQANLEKQAKVLSTEALTEKKEKLLAERKKSEREFADKEEQLRASMQRKQMSLRDRQMAVVKDMSEEKSWGAVLDRQTPGLICCSSAIDRTDAVLKIIDEKYASSAKGAKVVASKDTKAAPKKTATA